MPPSGLDRVVEGRTILEYFGLPISADAQGVPLTERMLHDQPARNNAALYGVHGGQDRARAIIRALTCVLRTGAFGWLKFEFESSKL